MSFESCVSVFVWLLRSCVSVFVGVSARRMWSIFFFFFFFLYRDFKSIFAVVVVVLIVIIIIRIITISTTRIITMAIIIRRRTTTTIMMMMMMMMAMMLIIAITPPTTTIMKMAITTMTILLILVTIDHVSSLKLTAAVSPVGDGEGDDTHVAQVHLPPGVPVLGVRAAPTSGVRIVVTCDRCKRNDVCLLLAYLLHSFWTASLA